MSTPTDDRSKAAIEAHSKLARALRDSHYVGAQQLAATHPELKLAEPPSADYEYVARIDFGGFLLVEVDVQIDDGAVTFQGMGAPAVGGGLTWGGAFMNYPLSKIRGWEANFEFVVTPTLCQVTFVGMSGENIGTCAGGGFGAGGGVGGGKGRFS